MKKAVEEGRWWNKEGSGRNEGKGVFWRGEAVDRLDLFWGKLDSA